MFIVLKLHRESFRQMMQQNRINRSIKIQVLQMLKANICDDTRDHGDIKDFLVFHYSETIFYLKTKKTAGEYFGRLRLHRWNRFKIQVLFGRLGHMGQSSWRNSNVRRAENMGSWLQRFVFFREIGTGTVFRAGRKIDRQLKKLDSENVLFIIERMAVLDICASRGFWTIKATEEEFDAISQGSC